LSSYREKDAIKHLLTIEFAGNSSKGKIIWLHWGLLLSGGGPDFIENQAESVSISRPLRRIADNLA
jgi:hypothetical protein